MRVPDMRPTEPRDINPAPHGGSHEVGRGHRAKSGYKGQKQTGSACDNTTSRGKNNVQVPRRHQEGLQVVPADRYSLVPHEGPLPQPSDTLVGASSSRPVPGIRNVHVHTTIHTILYVIFL